MNKLFKFILPIGLVPILANCGSKPSSDVTHYVTFHQELAEDKKVAFTKDTTDGEIIAQEPDIVAKDGYSAKWEDYTIVGKTEDFTVNAIYTENTYTARFRAKGVIVAEVPFTVNDVKGEHPKLPESRTPKCPSDVWYTYEWEDYKLELNDVVINAVQSGMVEHLAKFTDGETVIKENIPFTREDVDSNYQLNPDIIPQEVKDYHHDSEHPTYWDNHWDFTVPVDADKVVSFDAAPTKHNFELMFVDFEGKQVGDIVNYQFDSEWSSIPKPKVPTKKGYTVTWPNSVEYTFTDDPMKVSPESSANTYTVSYEGKTGTDSFTYDASYKLKYAEDNPDDIVMWHHENTAIPNEGIWSIDSDVTLSKKQVINVDFEGNYMPKFFSDFGQAPLSVTSEMASKGKYSLKVDGSNGKLGRVLISMDYLNNVFSDNNVQSLAFDIYSKDLLIKNNIEFDYVNDSGQRARLSPVVKFEGDDDRFGITNRWKTFYMERSTYNALVATNTKQCMFYTDFNADTPSSDKVIYLDNFRRCYDAQNNHINFEGGIINPNDKKIYMRHATAGNTFYHAAVDATKYGTVGWSFDDKWSSKDKYSLKMTVTPVNPKSGCYVAFYISEQFYNVLGEEGLKFDFYTDHFIGASALQYGNNDSIDISRIAGGESITITIPKDKITKSANDHRFFIANGNASKQNPDAGTGDWTVFTYNFDNVRPATED